MEAPIGALTLKPRVEVSYNHSEYTSTAALPSGTESSLQLKHQATCMGWTSRRCAVLHFVTLLEVPAHWKRYFLPNISSAGNPLCLPLFLSLVCVRISFSWQISPLSPGFPNGSRSFPCGNLHPVRKISTSPCKESAKGSDFIPVEEDIRY